MSNESQDTDSNSLVISSLLQELQNVSAQNIKLIEFIKQNEGSQMSNDQQVKDVKSDVSQVIKGLDGTTLNERNVFYAIANGKENGVFGETDWSVVELLTSGYSGNSQQKFSTRDKAEEFIIKFEEELKRKNPDATYYYDLTVDGRAVGVFESWKDMKPHFIGCDKARYRRVSTTSDGVSYIKSMACSKFTYFKEKPIRKNGKEVPNVCRMIFALAGQNYEDKIVTFPDWPNTKLPLVEDPTQPVNTIARYLARNFGNIAGKNAWEEAQVDFLVDQIVDFRTEVQKFFIIAFEILQEEGIETVKTKVLIPGVKKHLPFFNNWLKSSNGFLVGNSVTYVDLGLAGFVNALQKKAPETLEAFPEIKAHSEKILAIPNIKAGIFYFLFAF